MDYYTGPPTAPPTDAPPAVGPVTQPPPTQQAERPDYMQWQPGYGMPAPSTGFQTASGTAGAQPVQSQYQPNVYQKTDLYNPYG